MNIWYLISLILIGLGVIIFIGCVLASVFAISKTASLMQATMNRIQTTQMSPLQTQVNALNQTVQTIKADVELKKNNLQYVTECFKGIKTNVTQLAETSKELTKEKMKKAESDPTIQAQTEQWTNTALGFMNRNR